MTNKNYRNGYAKEKRAREYLEKKGYAVMESRGSHGPADLLAARLLQNETHRIVAVQVKGGSSKFGRTDAYELFRFAQHFDAVPLLCGRRNVWSMVAVAPGVSPDWKLLPIEDWWW